MYAAACGCGWLRGMCVLGPQVSQLGFNHLSRCYLTVRPIVHYTPSEFIEFSLEDDEVCCWLGGGGHGWLVRKKCVLNGFGPGQTCSTFFQRPKCRTYWRGEKFVREKLLLEKLRTTFFSNIFPTIFWICPGFFSANLRKAQFPPVNAKKFLRRFAPIFGMYFFQVIYSEGVVLLFAFVLQFSQPKFLEFRILPIF